MRRGSHTFRFTCCGYGASRSGIHGVALSARSSLNTLHRIAAEIGDVGDECESHADTVASPSISASGMLPGTIMLSARW